MYNDLYASYGRGHLPTRTFQEAFEMIPLDIRATFMPGYGSVGVKAEQKSFPGKGRGRNKARLNSPGNSNENAKLPLNETLARNTSENSKLNESKEVTTPLNTKEPTVTKLSYRGRGISSLNQPKSDVISTQKVPQFERSVRNTYREKSQSLSSLSSRKSSGKVSEFSVSMVPEIEKLTNNEVTESVNPDLNITDFTRNANSSEVHPEDGVTLCASDTSSRKVSPSANCHTSDVSVLSNMMDKMNLKEAKESSGAHVGMDRSQLLDNKWIKVSNIPIQEVDNITNKVDGSFYDCIPFYGEIEDIVGVSDSQFKIKFKYRASSDSFMEAFQDCDCFSPEVPIKCEKIVE